MTEEAEEKKAEPKEKGEKAVEQAQGQEGQVVVKDPDQMNLLGLLMANIIKRAVEKPAGLRRCRKLRGEVQVQAGRMGVRLKFLKGPVEVARSGEGKARASISGDLAAFTNVALGGGIVGPYLKGKLKASGNLFFLLKLLPLMRVV